MQYRFFMGKVILKKICDILLNIVDGLWNMENLQQLVVKCEKNFAIKARFVSAQYCNHTRGLFP